MEEAATDRQQTFPSLIFNSFHQAYHKKKKKKQVAVLHPNKYFSIIRKYSHLFLQDTDSLIKRKMKTCQAFFLQKSPAAGSSTCSVDVVYCVFKAFIGADLKQFDTWLDDGHPVLMLSGERLQCLMSSVYLMSSSGFSDTCVDGSVPSTCRPVTVSHGCSPLQESKG